MTSTETIDVAVLEIHDNPPVFSQLFSANVLENAFIGTSVLRVTSTDADIEAITRYSIVDGPLTNFVIDPVTGVISVSSSIDRELAPEFIFKVAANNGYFNSETFVTITVLDVNDNVPFCNQPLYQFSAIENQTIGSFIGNVSATDLDLIAPDNEVFFRLRYPSNSIGVYPSALFFREVLSLAWAGQNPAPQNAIYLTLSAVDRGLPPLTSTCLAIVNILPVNLYAPQFSQSIYQAPIPSNAPIGLKVVIVFARY